MNRTEYLLTCVAEECSEVAQRVSKALRFGLSEFEPGQEQPYSNAERIIVEFQELVAVLKMLEDDEVLEIEPTYTPDIRTAKRERVMEYMRYSRACGTLGRK